MYLFNYNLANYYTKGGNFKIALENGLERFWYVIGKSTCPIEETLNGLEIYVFVCSLVNYYSTEDNLKIALENGLERKTIKYFF